MKRFIFGLCFLLSIAGKECPTATKQHLTRCDLFYKCLVLPANGQVVWIPSKCDRGLVYEAALELCVLPGEIWAPPADC